MDAARAATGMRFLIGGGFLVTQYDVIYLLLFDRDWDGLWLGDDSNYFSSNLGIRGCVLKLLACRVVFLMFVIFLTKFLHPR